MRTFRAFPKTLRDPPGVSNQSFIDMNSVGLMIAMTAADRLDRTVAISMHETETL
jgi:hypothetical protein